MAKAVSKPSQQATSSDTAAIITILLLIFLYPVGLIVMWAVMKWRVWIKLLITLPLISVIAVILMGLLSASTSPQLKNRIMCAQECQQTYTQDTPEYRNCVFTCTKQ